MQYMTQTVDDAESNIFEGLQAMTDGDIVIPDEWRDDLDDHDPNGYSRSTLNGRIDLDIECWECRLA